jgi:hypothetical protein
LLILKLYRMKLCQSSIFLQVLPIVFNNLPTTRNGHTVPSNRKGTPMATEAQIAANRANGCGRDAGFPAPPAQIRTCGIPAYGSYLG